MAGSFRIDRGVALVAQTPQLASIAAEPRMFVFRYRSPEHWLDVFKTFYGPMLNAFAALDATAQEALRRDLRFRLSHRLAVSL